MIHHRIDGVLQFEEFPPHVHGDFLGQVAVGNGGRHGGDVTHLRGQVGCHEVYVVGKVFPGTGHAFHLGLTAKFSFGADFASHAIDFGGERAQLVHHRVDGLGGAQELAFKLSAVDFQGHALGEIPFSHCANDTCGFTDRMGKAID